MSIFDRFRKGIELETTLDDILKKPHLFKEMLQYCSVEHSEESLKFLSVVAQYRNLAFGKRFTPMSSALAIGAIIPANLQGGCNTMGRYIYDTYCAPNSPETVNIGSTELNSLTKIANSRGNPFVPDDFNDGCLNVIALIGRDTLPRLKNVKAAAATAKRGGG